MLIKACINGSRGVDEHARLSVDARLLAREAAGAVAAGAGAIHVHPKSSAGRDSLDATDVAMCVTAIRDACPGVPVGVTTGAWAAADPDDRLAMIAAWPVLPDFASVNWHEDGADEVAGLLLCRGVGVEAGIWHTDGLDRWRDSPHRGRCLRALIEVPDMPAVEVRDAARRLIDPVTVSEPSLPVLLHGQERSAWPALDLAIEWNLDTRIGLEDTLTMPHHTLARDNVALVKAARTHAAVSGR